MPSILNTATSLALKGAGAAVNVGGFVLGQANDRLRSLRGGDDGARYAPTAPAPGRGGERLAEPRTGGSAKAAGTRMAPPAPKSTPTPGTVTKTSSAITKPTTTSTSTTASKTSSASVTTPARGARISNPKAAKAVRKRAKAEAAKKAGAAATTKATGTKLTAVETRGGRPESVKANTPSERSAAASGKEPAPLGATSEDRA